MANFNGKVTFGPASSIKRYLMFVGWNINENGFMTGPGWNGTISCLRSTIQEMDNGCCCSLRVDFFRPDTDSSSIKPISPMCPLCHVNRYSITPFFGVSKISWLKGTTSWSGKFVATKCRLDISPNSHWHSSNPRYFAKDPSIGIHPWWSLWKSDTTSD